MFGAGAEFLVLSVKFSLLGADTDAGVCLCWFKTGTGHGVLSHREHIV